MLLVYTKTMLRRADWLLKLRIWAVGFATKNIAIVPGINESNSSFCALLSHCFSIYTSPQCQCLAMVGKPTTYLLMGLV